VTNAPDEDGHLEIHAADDAFVVLEVPPKFPLRMLPSKGEMITTWEIVRKDGRHQWWEVHPLVGWVPVRSTCRVAVTFRD
jgi:hypothetical protein